MLSALLTVRGRVRITIVDENHFAILQAQRRGIGISGPDAPKLVARAVEFDLADFHLALALGFDRRRDSLRQLRTRPRTPRINKRSASWQSRKICWLISPECVFNRRLVHERALRARS